MGESIRGCDERFDADSEGGAGAGTGGCEGVADADCKGADAGCEASGSEGGT